MDDKKLNTEFLKYNDMRYLTKWDQELDIKYMKDHGMIKEHYSYFNEAKKFPDLISWLAMSRSRSKARLVRPVRSVPFPCSDAALTFVTV